MAGDYVPSGDPAFTAWLYNLVSGVNTYLTELGLTAPDVLPVQTVYSALNTSVTDYGTKKLALTGASNDKKNKRADALEIVRPFVQRIQHAPGMTDQMRGELGLPVRSPRTTHSIEPDVPNIVLDTLPGQVIVHFGTDPGNERINGRPVWAQGCNIYRRKAGETEFVMLAFQKSSPYVDQITGDGQDYTYIVRYRGTNATDIGAQSLTATVAARGEIAA
jgi:hypothetical protein